MCRLTGGVVEGTVGTAGAVLWARAALELRKTRSAVARFPLRGRSSGSNSRNGRVSTSTLLTLEQRVDDGAYDPFVPVVKGESLTVQTVEETAGLVRGRRRLGEDSLGSTKKSGPPRELNVRDDHSRFMELEEGAQPSVFKAMEKAGTEVRVEETAVRDKSEKKGPFLEETVESLKEDVLQIKQDLRESRACEQDLQDKLQ
ncbi:hypothetical protein NDU88_000297 [Pleurodeles waltl]|uniref:Uncharacterized protein n=1 Tax=Pleurodeles waltl TaxID=8319 RepID=A0AAV7URT2_PLEWA|nr:hypothetical protein NDU88_000297 [Pleurodeles waltl]